MCDKYVKFDSDNLIYNRFDLIHADEFERFFYEFADNEFCIDVFVEDSRAKLNVWGKTYPQEVFERCIKDIFHKWPDIMCIELKNVGNDYKGFLSLNNDIELVLPKEENGILSRVRAKHRTNYKNTIRQLEDEVGKLELVHYSREIPDELVELFFDWKKGTHEKEYNMLPKQYLRQFYVTDALRLKSEDKELAVLFYCKTEDVVYFENFSYNREYEKYSPGFILYVKFLETLVLEKCSKVYLGGGNYSYKKRFDSVEYFRYSGVIYNELFFEKVNAFFREKSIRKIAIYGLGKIGQMFLKYVNFLDVNVLYGIDREVRQLSDLEVRTPYEETGDVDAIIITLKEQCKEVERLLCSSVAQVYYWNEIEENILKQNKM